jgi:hypothetical protein
VQSYHGKKLDSQKKSMEELLTLQRDSGAKAVPPSNLWQHKAHLHPVQLAAGSGPKSGLHPHLGFNSSVKAATPPGRIRRSGCSLKGAVAIRIVIGRSPPALALQAS